MVTASAIAVAPAVLAVTTIVPRIVAASVPAIVAPAIAVRVVDGPRVLVDVVGRVAGIAVIARGRSRIETVRPDIGGDRREIVYVRAGDAAREDHCTQYGADLRH